MSNDVNVVSLRKQLDTFAEYYTIVLYSSLAQNTLHDDVREIIEVLERSFPKISLFAIGFTRLLSTPSVAAHIVSFVCMVMPRL